jgi:hypothetical protein
MDDAMLRGDCARCAALCCVGLAFDRSEHFGFDKDAGVPCVHLVGHRCAIHRTRNERGFGGCASYDCAGAGQRVTQSIFEGRSWRDEPALLAPMIDAFRAARDAHALLVLLHAARRLPLDVERERVRSELEAELGAPHDAPEMSRRVAAFLQSLRELVPEARRRRLPVVLANSE